MRNVKIGLSLLVALGAVMVPMVAQADPTVKLEPGVAIPMTSPQNDRFDAGGAVMFKPLFPLTNFLDIAPSVSFMALPSSVSGVNAGTVWGLGGGLRIKRPHDETNTGKGFSAVSPWADTDLQVVHTGELNRGALSLAVGASVPTGADRMLWVGPFARYTDVFEGTRVGFDATDAHVLILGVSLELGPKSVQRQPEVVSEPADRDHDGTPDVSDRCPDVPGPKENQGCPWPTPQVEKKVEAPPPVHTADLAPVELTAVVHFDWDSANLRPSENTYLSDAVKMLLTNVDYHVSVEGHASSEGQAAHNQKLSEKRAKAVLEYLVSQGVARNRLTSVGRGSSVPVADNKTEAGRRQNRRVEFVVKLILVKSGEGK